MTYFGWQASANSADLYVAAIEVAVDGDLASGLRVMRFGSIRHDRALSPPAVRNVQITPRGGYLARKGGLAGSRAPEHRCAKRSHFVFELSTVVLLCCLSFSSGGPCLAFAADWLRLPILSLPPKMPARCDTSDSTRKRSWRDARNATRAMQRRAGLHRGRRRRSWSTRGSGFCVRLTAARSAGAAQSRAEQQTSVATAAQEWRFADRALHAIQRSDSSATTLTPYSTRDKRRLVSAPTSS